MLIKLTFKAGLGAEMEQHLSYKKNSRSDNSNSRNGYGSKTIKTDTGEVEINTHGIVMVVLSLDLSRKAKAG